MTAERVDVLVVGAGPTGLLMAAELARHGASVRIVDRAPAPSDRSKALGLQARTLEILDNIGVVDGFLERGHKLFAMSMYAGKKRIAHVSMDELQSPYPFILVLPQKDTEELLIEHLGGLGVHVERNLALSALEQDGVGVDATLVNAQGDESRCRASWVIGCDGAHSTVRACLELPYTGVDIETPFVFVDARMSWDRPDDEGHVFFAPEGTIGALPVPRLGDGYWRIIASMEPDAVPDELDLALFQRLMDERAGIACDIGDPVWMTSFVVRQRKVDSYRRGRVLVAGDAAHCHSPAGGQGMNTGLQDAYNLAWKLALVIRGAGRPELLDSYEREREPIAGALLQGTEQATRAVTLRNPVAQAVRNQVARLLTSLEVVQQRLTRSISEIDISYRKSPIVGEDRQSVLAVALAPKRSAEAPGLGQWRDFGAGPRPGDRAPDVAIAAESGDAGAQPGQPGRLFDLLRGTRHTLLLFDGPAATREGYENLAGIAASVAERYSDFIDVHVVVPGAARPEALAWDGSVILDGAGALHHGYGASAECLYLIRPDGYIGYRAQPASGDALHAYLATIFV